jgi:hypothetical protein
MSSDWNDIPLELGTKTDGEPLLISEEDRMLHMHVIGASGTGKTKFYERLIRHDIDNGQGVCILDPTGNLYNDIVRWCETHYMHKEREIILVDPTEDDWVFGFNPLAFGMGGTEAMDADELAFSVAATRAAIQRAWGESKNVATPQLRRLLNLLMYTLAEHRLTLVEGQLLMHPDPASPVRYYLTKMLQNQAALHEWEGLSAIRPFEYENLFGSVRNRLFEFLLQPRLAATISQHKTIDFRRAMDQGHVVLVNLATGGNRVHPDVAKLIGSLIVNACVLAARSRTDIPKEERRPFYLYIDECHRYLNDDIAEILDELRQFRLHLILAHQDLTQLRIDGSERIAGAIMGNAATKVVFRCPAPGDNEAMAARIYRGAIDLEEPKHRFDKPAPSGTFRKETLRGRTDTDTVTAPGQTVTVVTDAEGNEMSRSVASNEGQQSYASGTSEHETLVPEYATMPTSGYSLQEQYERRAAHIATLPKRHAIVK